MYSLMSETFLLNEIIELERLGMEVFMAELDKNQVLCKVKIQ